MVDYWFGVMRFSTIRRFTISFDGRFADHAETPETMLEHDFAQLGNISWVSADQQRFQIFDATDHRSRFPFQGGFSETIKPRLIRDNLDEDPIPHLGIYDNGFDVTDFHSVIFRVIKPVAHIDRS